MKSILLLLTFIFLLTPSYSQVLNLKHNYWGKIKDFSWNGKTSLALEPDIGEKIDLSIIINDKEIPLIKVLETNLEQIIYSYTPKTPLHLQNKKQYILLSINKNKPWLFRKHQIKVTANISSPKLKIITTSPVITHGGTGLVTFESEKKADLSFLALIDEKTVTYFPQTLLKDGYYILLFSWYTEYSSILSNQYLLAMDNSGNITTVPITAKAKLRNYRKKNITLPNNYATQKAKEFSLSKKEAIKLEGNIKAINSLLSSQKKVSRWLLTRTNFHDSIRQIIKTPFIFSKPSTPMSNYIITSQYGDQRHYFYKKKLVRSSTHRGLDFASYKNTPLYALLDGTVVYADWNSGNGKNIIIAHGLGVFSSYSHNEKLLVKKGDKVKAGQQISISGTTGQSTGDHLHLAIIIQGMYVEPKEWLSDKSLKKLFFDPISQALTYIKNTTNH